MSNSYLCDGCGNYIEPITFIRHDTIDCFRYGAVSKIVLPDGYQGDPKKLCAHWKERV